MLENAHLVVVDDEEARRMLTLYLLKEHQPAHVQGVASVAELLTYLAASFQQGRAVDLILMDIHMPGVDGIEGCRQVRDIPVCRNIPVLMLTSMEQPEVLQAAFEAGALDYVRKNSDPIELLARVRSALRLKRESDQLRSREQELLEVTRQLMSEKAAAQKTSYTDELTGLYDASAFQRIARSIWDKAYAAHKSVALLLIGVDHFQEYLLQHDRARADALLKAVAGVLPANDRQTYAVRFDSSIFAVLLTEDCEAEAPHVAQRILERVRKLRIPHDSSETDTIATVSVGYTIQHPTSEAQLEQFLKIARQALIEAGKQGYNRSIQQRNLLESGPFRPL
ncbi:MAG: diguanylate cyclase domain-containing protein [Candidatus Sericytochromatia bacterium]